MNEEKYYVGDYSMNVVGTLSLVSTGPRVIISASGELGSLIMNASKSAGMFCGPAVLSLVQEDPAQGQVALLAGEAGTIKLIAGPPLEGAVISMMAEEISLSVGAPGTGSSIVMTPESVTIKVAEVTFTITPEGITEDVAEVTREMTAEGHNLTAAETEFNVGVQGESKEGPTKTEEVEGGAVENETLTSNTTDAAKNDDAGIMIAE